MKKVDTKAAMWAVVTIPEAVKKEMDFLKDVDTLTFQAVSKGEKVALTMAGEGQDAEKIKAAADTINKELDAGKAMIKAQVAQMPAMKSVADFYDSMKAETEGKSGKVTGEMNANIMDALMVEMGPMLMMALQELEQEEHAPAGGAATQGGGVGQ
jgi:hypothetical protein